VNSRIIVVLVAIACAAGLRAQQAPPGAQGPGAQQPEPPIFRVQVDAIELDAFVTDAQGNPVTDLTVDDFEVLEDGRPQAISSLTLVNIPIERVERPLFSPRAIEPDVQTNTRGEGRIYVIAADEVNPQLVLRTRLFLRRFIEQHFAANDIAAFVYVGRGRGSDAQDFTSNRRLLIEAIDKFGGGFASMPAPPGVQALAPGPAVSAEAEALVRARARALRDLTEFMAKMRGRRKTMIYVTETLGDVFSVLDYNGGARSLAFDDLHAAVTAATRGNVSIYPIDPRGLSADGGVGDSETAPEPAGPAGLARLQELRALAEATGGFAVVNSNRFDDAFTRIVRENSSYYVLGFTSTNDRRDGRFRRLQVRVKRPGLTVRARAGYLAPMRTAPTVPAVARDAGALPLPIAESLASPMPNPGVPMRVFAAAYKGADRQATVALAIEMEVAALDLVERGGAFVGDIVVATTAIAAGGKVHPGQRQQARLTLRPETYERAKSDGIRVLSELQLPPGRYQLRVAGGTPSGRAGSVIHDLEVPDFTKEPLVMSGVSLTSTAVQDSATVRAAGRFPMVLPAPVTTRREFQPGETLTLYTEVYENLRNDATHTVDLTVELRTDDGRVVSSTAEQRSSKELGGRSGGYGFVAQVPLRDAEPGIYVIHVEARANMGARPTVARDIQIRVR
jgi:VWFA-related protein